MAYPFLTPCPRVLLSLSLALSLGLAACSQDEGETCQVTRDCADGLTCVRARGSERGTCEDPANIEDDDGSGTGNEGDAAALPDDLDAAISGDGDGDGDTGDGDGDADGGQDGADAG